MSTIINQLPAPTWRWLKMNGAKMPEDGLFTGAVTQKEAVAELPAGLLTEEVPAELWSAAGVAEEETARLAKEREGELEPETVREKDLPSTDEVIYSGAGTAVDAWVAESGAAAKLYTAPAGQEMGPLRLSFAYADGEMAVSAVKLRAEKDSRMTVVMDYTSAEGASGTAAVQTKLRLFENALVRLVQIHRPDKAFTFVNDIGAICAAGARLEIIHLILSGGKTYEGCRVDLNGDESSLKIDTAYLAEGESERDFNYFANHIGKKTESEINADGVLRGNAKKIFRGTIDFKRGASGAVGNEKEDVLLMDDTVVNKTIPLILCAEEDVVGNHGATIGRLDEQLLFYLESRGMDRAEVYEMMARARLDAVIAKIPDEKMREALSPSRE